VPLAGLRGLMDYLEQHPEALVRGKAGGGQVMSRRIAWVLSIAFVAATTGRLRLGSPRRFYNPRLHREPGMARRPAPLRRLDRTGHPARVRRTGRSS